MGLLDDALNEYDDSAKRAYEESQREWARKRLQLSDAWVRAVTDVIADFCAKAAAAGMAPFPSKAGAWYGIDFGLTETRTWRGTRKTWTIPVRFEDGGPDGDVNVTIRVPYRPSRDEIRLELQRVTDDQRFGGYLWWSGAGGNPVNELWPPEKIASFLAKELIERSRR